MCPLSNQSQMWKERTNAGNDSVSPRPLLFNNKCGRRARSRLTTDRPRLSTSSSPKRRKGRANVKTIWPSFRLSLSPPLCHSPSRNPAPLLYQSQTDFDFDPVENHKNEQEGSVAYFSPRPPLEPLHLIMLPPVEHPPGFKIVAKTSYFSSRTSKNALKSLKTFPEVVARSRESRKIVRHLLRSLLLKLPVKDATISCTSTNQKISRIGSMMQDIEKRSVAVQALNIYKEDSVDHTNQNSGEGDTLLEKKMASQHGWIGGLRALRDSHLRLVMRQLRQLRQIERVNRSLKRSCSPSPHTKTPCVS